MTAITTPVDSGSAASGVRRRAPHAGFGLTVAAAVAAALLTSLAQTCEQSVLLGEQRRQTESTAAAKPTLGAAPGALGAAVARR